MQINMTGFLNGKNARTFMQDLWELLISAQESVTGIPQQFLDSKKEEIKKRMVRQLWNNLQITEQRYGIAL